MRAAVLISMYDDVGDVGDVGNVTVSPVEDYKAGKGSVISAAGLCMQSPPIKGWSCNLAVRANGLRRARMGRSKPCCGALLCVRQEFGMS
jgi:hypothetical protein